MTGLIWTIQSLHYPTFLYVPENQFQKFHAFHSKTITFIVLPMMVFELVTAVRLVFYYPGSRALWMNVTGLGLIWLCTFFISVPLHYLLVKNKSEKVIERLVLTNWIRTLLWSIRLCLLMYIFIKIFEGTHINVSA